MDPERDGARLPDSRLVDVGKLAGIFDKRVSSYKFFFLLAILDRIEERALPADPRGNASQVIPLDELAVDMAMLAWYPNRFCRLSFGSSDSMSRILERIAVDRKRPAWISRDCDEWKELRRECAASDTRALLRYVPYRLIRPFFPGLKDGTADSLHREIARRSVVELETAKPFYFFTEDGKSIVISPSWLAYFSANAGILRGWIRFKLAEFLQRKNPMVPGLMDKLQPPLVRESLDTQRKWWREAIDSGGGRFACIYTGTPLSSDDFSLDHYLPWSFLANDRLWNLVPAEKSVNSSKSDNLPSRKYLEPLVTSHFNAIKTLHEAWPENRWMKAVEPFLVDLRLEKTGLLDINKLRRAYEDAILPLTTIAHGQGFPEEWVFQPT